MNKKIMILVFMLIFITFLYLPAFSQETLTITTYYPSPFGNYQELRAQRMAIGNTWFNPANFIWKSPPCTGAANEICNADLVVEGNVGIGTTSPLTPTKLDVNGNFAVTEHSSGDGGIFMGYISSLGGGAINVFSPDGATYNPLKIAATNFSVYSGAAGITLGLYVANNGNVGIGNIAPGSKLVVQGSGSTSATSGLNVTNSAGTSTLFVRDDNRVGIGNTAPGSKLVVQGSGSTSATSGLNVTNSAGTSTLFVRNDGNVGIGTASPGAKLHVNGNIRIPYNMAIKFGNTDGVVDGGGGEQIRNISPDGTTGFGLAFYVNGTETMRIKTGGDVGIGTVSPGQKLDVNGNVSALAFLYSSDSRLKKNINSINNTLGKLENINGVTFNWKDEARGKRGQFGLLAQEVEKVLPEVVFEGKDGYKSIDYARLIPVLIQAVKEQQKEISSLKEELKKLKN